MFIVLVSEGVFIVGSCAILTILQLKALMGQNTLLCLKTCRVLEGHV